MGTAVDASNKEVKKDVRVIFVLGGPGSGKGTQCANIVRQFGYTHLSAGDLLRAEIKSGSENGTMIQNMISEGKIVPSEVTIKLLQRAIEECGNDKFLIDGFPRNEENRAAFESVTGIVPDFVLFFDCSEEEMERRLLNRNQGREDDNIETIRKRFKVYMESTLPVIEHYNSRGKVRKIDAAKPVEAVFEDVNAVFASIDEKDDKLEGYLKIGLHNRKLHVQQLQEEVNNLRKTQVNPNVVEEMQRQLDVANAENRQYRDQMSSLQLELQSVKEALKSSEQYLVNLQNEVARLGSELKGRLKPEKVGLALNSRFLEGVKLCQHITLLVDPHFPINFFDERNKGAQGLSDLQDFTNIEELSSHPPGNPQP